MATTSSNVSPTTIRNRYPTLLADWDDVGSIRLLAQNIEDAEQDVAESTFGSLRERAISSLVAHRMLLRAQESDGDTGAAYALSQSQAGGVSVSYVTPPPDATPVESMHYYTTKAGVEYMELSRRMAGGMRLV